MRLPLSKVLDTTKMALAKAQVELLRFEKTGSRNSLLDPLVESLVCLEMCADSLCLDKAFLDKFKADTREVKERGF